MKKEIRVPFEKLQDNQTITEVNERMFEEAGMNIHRHECDLEDDHDRQERIYHLQTEKKYFFQGRT